jgi:hypothetical protein
MKPFAIALSVGGEGGQREDEADNLSNVQCKALGKCRNAFPLYLYVNENKF